MGLEKLSKDATIDAVIAALDRDGGVIIEGAMSAELLCQAREQLAPYIEHTPDGVDEFVGRRTRRVGALLGRSAACGDLTLDPLVNGVAARFLSRFCDSHQLNLTQAVSIGPGEKGQILHRDRTLWGGYVAYEIETHLSTIWAITDFTADNGGTRIIPGSHLWPEDRIPDPDEAIATEMSAGSVLLYTGKVIHGGGPNITEERRLGIIIHYILGWLRQEENQYLSCPPDVAATLAPELRALAGYSKASYSLGFFSTPGRPGEGFELASPGEMFGEPPPSFEHTAGMATTPR